MGSGVGRTMIGKEERQLFEQGCRSDNLEARTEEKDPCSEVSLKDSSQWGDRQPKEMLQKQMQLVARENKHVEVIKMLRQIRRHDQTEMPQLKPPRPQQLQPLQPKKQPSPQHHKEQLIQTTSQIENPFSKEQAQGNSLEASEPKGNPFQKVQAQNLQTQKAQEQNNLFQNGQEQNPLAQKGQAALQPLEPAVQTEQVISIKQAGWTVQQELSSPRVISSFSPSLKSQTIWLDQSCSVSLQKAQYYQNQKLVLSAPLLTEAQATFKIEHLKYCVGVGVALLQVISKHSFNYKSYSDQLAHGLYIVTSQGYSWSHHLKEEDDQLRPGFNKAAAGDLITVTYEKGQVGFRLKEHWFELEVPSHVAEKYSLCFCAYLHQKDDSVSLQP